MKNIVWDRTKREWRCRLDQHTVVVAKTIEQKETMIVFLERLGYHIEKESANGNDKNA